MIRSAVRFAPAVAVLALALAPLPALPAAAVETRPLPDSTTIETWRLGNGIEIATQDIPGAQAVAITAAYPTGTDSDPPARRGLAQLTAEMQMMAPAGNVPERTREEMSSLRPLGWTIKVGRRITQLSEVTTRDQFPGALRQMAARMGGVKVTESARRAALAAVRRDLGERLFGTVDNALYFQVREYGRGADQGSIVELAAARGLDGVTARELERRLRDAFAPTGSVLALAGDFKGVDLHALIEREFGSLPGGRRPADPAAGPAVGNPADLGPSVRALVRPEVDRPIGVLGVIAPALTDTLHPAFFLSSLVIGQHCRYSWPPIPQLGSRFRYSILDEPDLVRFYPAVAPDSTDPGSVGRAMNVSLNNLMSLIVMSDEYDELRENVAWLLGGPMPPHALETVRKDAPSLNNLCNNLAARELMGGEPFWSEYRRRFLAPRPPGLNRWGAYMSAPAHQISVLFVPEHK